MARGVAVEMDAAGPVGKGVEGVHDGDGVWTDQMGDGTVDVDAGPHLPWRADAGDGGTERERDGDPAHAPGSPGEPASDHRGRGDGRGQRVPDVRSGAGER